MPEWLRDFKQNEKKVTCLFGEHLLNKNPNNWIGLVEAPKTAIISSLYFGFPDHQENLLWLAVYNKSSLNYEKCKNLIGRKVILFPDLSINGKTFEHWKDKSVELSRKLPGSNFITSDLLEKNADKYGRELGADIADYLININWKNFR